MSLNFDLNDELFRSYLVNDLKPVSILITKQQVTLEDFHELEDVHDDVQELEDVYDGVQECEDTHSSSSQSKIAKEFIKELLDKRNLAQDIQEKREHVKNMKRRRREAEETQRDGKVFTVGQSRSKEDMKEYRNELLKERELHNSMEKQRRIELKDSFDYLKATMPPTRDNDKVSKLNIINTALDYCRDLEEAERKISEVKQRELDRRRYLMMKLSSLSSVCQSEMTRHDET